VEAKAPAPSLVRALTGLPPGRAIDIACGTGRHSIWLHERGWQVVAVDRNAEAIGDLTREYPEIDSRVLDLEQSPPPLEPAAYDLVICWLYFQRDLYPLIRDAVRPGGLAAISALLQGRFAAGPGELLSYFPRWEILHQAETEHGPEKRATELIVRRV
jgi:SAM-dependent methyltransferase